MPSSLSANKLSQFSLVVERKAKNSDSSLEDSNFSNVIRVTKIKPQNDPFPPLPKKVCRLDFIKEFRHLIRSSLKTLPVIKYSVRYINLLVAQRESRVLVA